MDTKTLYQRNNRTPKTMVSNQTIQRKNEEEQIQEEIEKKIDKANSKETVALELYEKGKELKDSGYEYLAILYFEASARFNNCQALNMCGYMNYWGYTGKYGNTIQNKNIAKSYFEQSAELGNGTAQDILKLLGVSKKMLKTTQKQDNSVSKNGIV